MLPPASRYHLRGIYRSNKCAYFVATKICNRFSVSRHQRVCGRDCEVIQWRVLKRSLKRSFYTVRWPMKGNIAPCWRPAQIHLEVIYPILLHTIKSSLPLDETFPSCPGWSHPGWKYLHPQCLTEWWEGERLITCSGLHSQQISIKMNTCERCGTDMLVQSSCPSPSRPSPVLHPLVCAQRRQDILSWTWDLLPVRR